MSIPTPPGPVSPSAASSTGARRSTVRRFHGPFHDKQLPGLFVNALRGAMRELGPNGMMNPGVVIDP